jgi:hypothetical protein
MKNIWKTLALAVAVTCSTAAFAQEKQDTIKFNPDKKIKKTAKKVGNKTAEVAVKGASTIVDKTYKDKVGPGGQKVYIDNKSRYYYISSKGAKVFVTKAQLQTKPATSN